MNPDEHVSRANLRGSRCKSCWRARRARWTPLGPSCPAMVPQCGADRTISDTFAWVSAAVRMKVRECLCTESGGEVWLHEKGRQVKELPCHRNLEQYLEEWITAARLADIRMPRCLSLYGTAAVRMVTVG